MQVINVLKLKLTGINNINRLFNYNLNHGFKLFYSTQQDAVQVPDYQNICFYVKRLM
jgi:hypothetical protein